VTHKSIKQVSFHLRHLAGRSVFKWASDRYMWRHTCIRWSCSSGRSCHVRLPSLATCIRIWDIACPRECLYLALLPGRDNRWPRVLPSVRYLTEINARQRGNNVGI
jgi:hypothetical protein